MKTRPIRDFPGGPGIKTPHFLHKTKKKGSFFKLKKKKKTGPIGAHLIFSELSSS